MQTPPFTEPISEHLWRTRYQWTEGGHMQEPSIEATWDRVALAVAGVEEHHRDDWREHFRHILRDFRFLPGGRILATAGTTRRATLFNCFVSGQIEDSIEGIFNALREDMQTLQAGGAIGIDFSTLRPAASPAVASGAIASGPVSFMKLWEAASTVLESGKLRPGAMLATLRCDHPDIQSFIDVKTARGALAHFKLSVAVTDEFMRAVEEDGPWPLVFPLGDHPIPVGGEVCERLGFGGSTTPQLCLVHRRLPARALWQQLVEAELANGQPGVLFIDQINRVNNLWYCERIATTSPGGEIPLPAHGACNLGSINLTRFVQHPFAEHPKVDFAGLRAVAGIATRFLDNVHDLSLFPLKAQEKTASASRRIGLGITGLADMFAMLGLRYGSPSSLDLTHEIMRSIRDTAYATSIAIAQHGIRNSHLLAVASTSAISLLANHVSSGIEPIFAFKTLRRVPGADDQQVAFEVEDAACRQYKALHGQHTTLPAHFVQAVDVSTEDQLRMMAAVQDYVDNAISQTVRLPPSISAQELELVLLQAWELGLKG